MMITVDVRVVLGTAALLSGLMPSSARGHDSPQHVIEALTEGIKTHGPTARLLMARAYEYQSSGDASAAAADFNAVLVANPRSAAALAGLAEISLQENNAREAASIARRGIALTDANQERFHALLARSHAQQKSWDEALGSWRRALESPQPEIAWFLGEAECLLRLSRPAEQVSALEKAMARNPSVVLHRAWIHALVDAGFLEEASRQIERGFAESRWRSSWLLLRARVHERNGRKLEQQADAEAALSELRLRLNATDSDPQLAADVAHALAILARREEALVQLGEARRLGASEATLARVDGLLHSR